MITAETRLRVNIDEVAGEVIDGEAVLINLSSGTYYTMDNVGAAVWSMIERGYSLAEMSDRLAPAYIVDREKILGDLRDLARDLLEQSLVVVDRDASSESGEVEVSANGSSYASPILNRYTDMAEVLALDPPLPMLKEDA